MINHMINHDQPQNTYWISPHHIPSSSACPSPVPKPEAPDPGRGCRRNTRAAPPSLHHRRRPGTRHGWCPRPGGTWPGRLTMDFWWLFTWFKYVEIMEAGQNGGCAGWSSEIWWFLRIQLFSCGGWCQKHVTLNWCLKQFLSEDSIDKQGGKNEDWMDWLQGNLDRKHDNPMNSA